MILAGDVGFKKSEVMDDTVDGGGAMTAIAVQDAVSNQIFPDVASLDEVYGAVKLRKIFAHVTTQDVDKFFGARVFLAKPPGNRKMGVSLFSTADHFDRRPSAASRIENYRALGGLFAGTVYGTQYQGSRILAVFQSESAPLPSVGDVLALVYGTIKTYIRIAKITTSVQTFTDGTGAYKKRVLDLQLSDVLPNDFPGVQIARADQVAPTAIYRTVLANAARYYSASGLKNAAALNDTVVKVDSVYAQVVPSSQSEIALIDVSASGSTVPIVQSSSATTTISVTDNFASNVSIYLGMACMPGTLSIPVAGGTLTDSAGIIKNGATSIGTIDYAAGVLKFGVGIPTYSGTKNVTFRPAAAPTRVADTASVRVTAANRGYVYTINIAPAPKAGSVQVSYRALGNWYTLYDNFDGALVGQESGIGSGTINYATGSVAITTGALPDVDSDLLFVWGQSIDYFNRSDLAVAKAFFKYQLLQKSFAPETLTISWNDGTARTASCNAAGVIAGAATGTLNIITGELRFSPNTMPLGSTEFTIAYSFGDAISKSIAAFNVSGSTAAFSLGDTNIIPSSLRIAWNGPWVADPLLLSSTPSGALPQLMRDNGSGGFAGRTATINYATGAVSIDVTASAPYRVVDMTKGTLAATLTQDVAVASSGGYYGQVSQFRTLYADAGMPASFDVSYRVSSSNSSASEVAIFSGITVDLTKQFNEQIVPSSVMFTVGSRTYIDRNGLLYYSVNPATGAGIYGGTIDYTSGLCQLAAYASGQSSVVELVSLLTTMAFTPVEYAVFRAPSAPLKPGVFTLRAVTAAGVAISGTADSSGVISNSNMAGFVEFDTGVVRVRFGQRILAAGHEGEAWYDPLNVVDGYIFKPKPVLADTIFFNTVAYSYLPLSAAILGLDPVRLPADGRVPIYSPGDVVVILHDQQTTASYTSNTTTQLNRGRQRKITVRDFGGNPLDVSKYTVDLDAGAVAWGNLSGVSQPLTIIDRIMDEAVCTDVQINGAISLSQPLSHQFPVGSWVANAVVFGNLFARVSSPFDQSTWTSVFSDALIGGATSAQYDIAHHPISVTNQSCIQERWALIFTSATAFNVVGEHVGQILSASVGATCAPINPDTGFPYFSLASAGWGSGWSAGNVLRFNTYAAAAPLWVVMAIAQGSPTSNDFSFAIECVGDIDNPN